VLTSVGGLFRRAALWPTRIPQDPEAIQTSMLLLPTPGPPVMRVAWTLRHEMLLYLVFVERPVLNLLSSPRPRVAQPPKET
jgi:hypothetical protein